MSRSARRGRSLHRLHGWVASALHARGGGPAGPLRTLRAAVKEALLCTWEALRVGLSSAFGLVLGMFFR